MKKDIQPAVLFAGLVVVGGIIIYSQRKRHRCEKLPDIYSKDGPLHLTQEAQDKAFEYARYKLREYILSGKEYRISDIELSVADQLRDCAWEKLESDEQKASWGGISSIVNEVNQMAKADPEEFLKSF